MTDLVCKIELFSDWHAGSGLASGSNVDLLVIKDKDGFPFIPGKTIKGILKDAAYDLLEAGKFKKEAITALFGQKDMDDTTDGKHSVSGNAHFSNAELTKHLKAELKGKTELLYRRISSTAIEENGLAKEKSLRRIEVTIPMVLFAKIENIHTKEERLFLEKCMKMVKRLGVGRNRGLGRCDLSIVSGDL